MKLRRSGGRGRKADGITLGWGLEWGCEEDTAEDSSAPERTGVVGQAPRSTTGDVGLRHAGVVVGKNVV